MAKLFFASFLFLQSLCDVFLSLIFEFFHFCFYACIRLVHWGRLTQFILSCNFIFIDTHDFRLTSLPLQKCWNLMTILIRVPTSTNSALEG